VRLSSAQRYVAARLVAAGFVMLLLMPDADAATARSTSTRRAAQRRAMRGAQMRACAYAPDVMFAMPLMLI